MKKSNTSVEAFQKEVLFEDNHLIIINKKPSQIVQPDKTGDVALIDLVNIYLRAKYNKPGNAFVGVVHRIDRPVSGIVIFAKTSKALERMNELIKSRNIKKIYWAVVKEPPKEPAGKLEHYIVRNKSQNKSFAHNTPKPEAQKAELHYKIIAHSDNFHLLEIELITGRHHQIRCQLAAIGSPIKGDIKYGYNRTNEDASIHLHARAVEFIHPVTKELILITAPTPKETLWQFFEQDN